MVASYMRDYTAFETLPITGLGTVVFTHNLHALHPGAGLNTTKQIVTVTPWTGGAGHGAVPYVSAQDDNSVTITGTPTAIVHVWVQAVHSIQQ